MARLIYGILSLILGSLALLLPETRKTVLPRTMQQVEILPTSISETFRRRRIKQIQRQALADAIPRPSTAAQLNDTASMTSGPRVNRIGPYDLQSTLHSVYELQEFGQDDIMPSLMNRHAPRRMDSRNTIFNQTFSASNIDSNRQRSIAEDAEYDEAMNSERKGLPLRARRSGEVILVPAPPVSLDHSPGERGGIAILPDDTKDPLNPDDVLSRSPRYRRTMSQDENYFSEHC